MNYIRGAVNAISAPYQYYRDLPPINPSTLTGAIDVIVLKRPTADGGSELVCSPFHVRFGKWQVLRPGEKKVNVSVNGHPIPYGMKIGDAGEAFFVFETDSDVPDELITSPLLLPTQPEQPDASAPKFDDTPTHDDAPKSDEKTLEPEFLDLDATPPPSFPANRRSSQPDVKPAAVQSLPSPPPTPTMDSHIPLATPSSLLLRMGTQADLPEHQFGQMLKHLKEDGPVPDVKYNSDIVLDSSGYHASQRQEPDRSLVSEKNESQQYSVPDDPIVTQPSRSTGPESPSSPGTTSSGEQGEAPVSFPPLRATSEPPPDLDDGPPLDTRGVLSLNSNLPVQEYSWEWGAFPQPSPIKTTSGKSRRFEGSLRIRGGTREGKGKLKLPAFDSHGQLVEEKEVKSHRSRSVPPELEGSPTIKRREITSSDDNHDDHDLKRPNASREHEQDSYGLGGRLKASGADPTRFVVCIEKRKMEFDLSLVSSGNVDERPSMETDHRGRRDRNGPTRRTRVLYGCDELEAARIFYNGRVNFRRFLEDENIVKHESLVIRWADDQYITRRDGSPLMDALVLWRETAIKERARGLPSRPSSPSSDEEDTGREREAYEDPLSSDERQDDRMSKSDLSEQRTSSRKPTSSSWVRWWRRGKPMDTEVDTSRPSQRDSALDHGKAIRENGEVEEKFQSTDSIKPHTRGNATTHLSTPPVEPSRPGEQVRVEKSKKFAKTLRLSSDQLRALNLKAGANTVTFSLSTSGTIACTARIFLWDSTDLVVVSDIDGTITKSDGLGHVFAMIGRDWTHVGVAKLYTDISRNGYKLMYLTSRAIGQADATRDYLKGIKQNNYQLPEGPVIMSPDRLIASLHREVIMRKPEVFKMACLRDIQRLFGEASRNPFYSGFGNRITDALSYRSVDVPSARIFTIDSSGEVKMELLELAGYKSSYIHMTDLVDQMFPPIHRKWAAEFTDFNYWKPPIQEFPLPDLTPPSPTLSARSDTSNQSTFSRLRNFSLVSNKQSNSLPSLLLPPETDAGKNANLRSTQLKQMSSFERLSNTLASFTHTSDSRRSTSRESRASTSLTYADSGSDDGYMDDEDLEEGGKWLRRRSVTSMPGSLDDLRFDVDDGIEEPNDLEGGAFEQDVEGEDGDVEEEEGAAEEAFDEDFLATTQMKNVPFL